MVSGTTGPMMYRTLLSSILNLVAEMNNIASAASKPTVTYQPACVLSSGIPNVQVASRDDLHD